jgi:hypothetical protein
MRRLAPLIVLVAALTLVVTVLAVFVAATHASQPRSLTPFRGTGTWVSIYDTAAWNDPLRVVSTLAAHGVHTLFLETSNYKQKVDVVRPAEMGVFLDAAHEAGLDVVGWYLPSLANPRRDLRRALAAVRFRSANGEAFDSVALDVESTKVRSVTRRNSRAVALATSLRRAAPASYALGAITIAPVGKSPSYWPSYPYKRLAAAVDVFLPMEYFTARTKGVAGVASYGAANVRDIRAAIGDPAYPMHPIAGEAADATPAEVAAFLDSVATCDVVGTSLWEYGQTTRAQWGKLASAGASYAFRTAG